MSRRVLLTGGTGFVGRHVLRALCEQKSRVRLVVRPGKATTVEHLNCIERIVSTPDLFCEDVAWWQQICDGIDTVVHVAWYAEPGVYLQSEKNLDCLIGTLRLAKGAAEAGVRRFVGVGTCFEYDLNPGLLSTGTPLKPQTPYAGAKAAAYLALSQWLPNRAVEFAWCRLFYLYGEGENPRRLVAYLRRRLAAGQVVELTSGEQIRDFLDVSDAGQAIVEVALGQVQGAINICSGEPITVRQLAERIADEYGLRALLRFGARPDNAFDPPRVVGVKSLKKC